MLQSPYAEALTTNVISRQTAHRYQALAAVPDAMFDTAHTFKIALGTIRNKLIIEVAFR
jgi:hypothetical protein